MLTTNVQFSVITICFNNLTELIKTCESVDSQSITPFEHIIIDGSNNEEIRKWLIENQQPPYRVWISEKDKGRYDAFNKGVFITQGAYLNFLNSGDLYLNNQVLAKVEDFIQKNPQVDWLSAKYKINKFNREIILGDVFSKKLAYRGMRKINHQTCFFRRELFIKNGLFLPYNIGMDFDHILRQIGTNYEFLDEPLVFFDNSGISSNNWFKVAKENIQIYEKYFGFSLKSRLWQFRNIIIHFLFKIPKISNLFFWKNKG